MEQMTIRNEFRVSNILNKDGIYSMVEVSRMDGRSFCSV